MLCLIKKHLNYDATQSSHAYSVLIFNILNILSVAGLDYTEETGKSCEQLERIQHTELCLCVRNVIVLDIVQTIFLKVVCG